MAKCQHPIKCNNEIAIPAKQSFLQLALEQVLYFYGFPAQY